MLKNYLKIALRNLKKYKGYMFINIVGLAVGIAVCLLIYLYVSHELSYDRYHEKSDRMYRVTMKRAETHYAVTPSMISPTLQQLYPEVTSGVRIFHAGSYRPLTIRRNDRIFKEQSFAYADSSLFDIFSFPLLSGNPETALTRPNTLVISRNMARKYFGDENPIGKRLQVNEREFEVTGVLKKIPANSHFHFDFFASMITLSDWSVLRDDVWRAANFYTYVVIEEGVEVKNTQQKVNEYLHSTLTDNDFVASLDLQFEPLTDIHLYSDVQFDISAQGDIRYVLAAGAIAILILIIACINYMNLATARSVRRSREVGIRKVLGSDRRRLIGQFYGEAAIMTLISLLVSILLIELSLPWFNQLTGQALSVDYSSPRFWSMLLGTGFLVTLTAGSYPALMLSSFKPGAVLRGAKITEGNSNLRKALVVFQFAASVFLIITTIVIYRQVDFVQQKELGYKQDNVLVLTASGEVERRFDAFKSELLEMPGTTGAAMASETPTNIRAGYGLDVEGLDEGPNFIVKGLRVNPDFTETLDIEVVAGQPFTKGDFDRANTEGDDAQYTFLANEATARYYGIDPEELVGRRATTSGRTGIIKGVVEDFHFTSLHQPISPLILFPQDGFNRLLISLNTTDIQQALANTRDLWTRMFPQQPFDYRFLDQEYEALYRQEVRAGNIFVSFALLAIFIACLGLVGLASYMLERRTREIGVRKVLGATTTHILTLFSRDFIMLVMLGYLIALPLSWYAINRWLQNFAYRIETGLTIFLAAGGLVVILTLATVSYHALKAVRLDAVQSLKRE